MKKRQDSHMAIKELDNQIAALSAADKIELHNKLVQSLVDDFANEWPGVEKTAGVVGGEARIVRSRIPVWLLENYRRLGWDDETILQNYPTLQIWDLQNAWAYVNANLAEIERTIQENEDA